MEQQFESSESETRNNKLQRMKNGATLNLRRLKKKNGTALNLQPLKHGTAP